MKPRVESERVSTFTPCWVTSLGSLDSAWATRFCTRTWAMSRSVPTAKVTFRR